MNGWILATLERGCVSPREGRFRGASIPMLLLLGGLLVWCPMRADAQYFQIKHIAASYEKLSRCCNAIFNPCSNAELTLFIAMQQTASI